IRVTQLTPGKLPTTRVATLLFPSLPPGWPSFAGHDRFRALYAEAVAVGPNRLYASWFASPSRRSQKAVALERLLQAIKSDNHALAVDGGGKGVFVVRNDEPVHLSVGIPDKSVSAVL